MTRRFGHGRGATVHAFVFEAGARRADSPKTKKMREASAALLRRIAADHGGTFRVVPEEGEVDLSGLTKR